MEVLVEARKEYTEQLCYYMIPVIVQTMADIYETSQKMERSVRQFQVLLQEVKQWNQVIVKQHADEMAKACPWFTELLTAVIVAHVKILSSVRVGYGQPKPKISIKMPSTELIIHSAYINCARDVYNDPDLFTSNKSDAEKQALLTPRFKVCIDQTIREFLPYQHILTTYIGDQTMNITVSDPEPEPEPEPEAEADAEAEAEGEPEKDESFFEEEKTSDESKWIGSGSQPTPPQQPQSLPQSTSGSGPVSTGMSSQTPISSNQPSSMQ